MLVLGLLLIIGAAVITTGAFFDAGETATVEILGQTLSTTAAGVFVIGAMTMLVFLLGVWCLMAGMTRGRRKRQERKAARSQHRDSVRSLEEERETLRLENERLAEQLKSRQGATAGAGAAGAAGGAAAAGGMSRDDYSTDRTMHDRDGDGVDDRAESSRSTSAAGAAGQRSFMDRVTGRHGSEPATTGSSTGSYDSTGDHRTDRVIDHDTDLRSDESTTTSRNREI